MPKNKFVVSGNMAKNEVGRSEFFGPGNGSPTAMNVAVGVVLVMLSDFQSTKTFPFLNQSQLNVD